MMTKALLIVTAAIEAGTGVALLVWPSVPVSLLFDTALDTPTGATAARFGGVALLSLGAACWLGRNDARSRAATGLVAALLLYNTAVVALLAYEGLSSGRFGVGLWPAIVLHAAMAVWCIACLRTKRA